MLLLAIKIALGPVFLLQAMNLRRKIVMLPDPDGDRQGLEGEGPLVRLLLLGDSAAVGVGVTNQSDSLKGQLVKRLREKCQVNFDIKAKTGSTSHDTKKYLLSIAPEPFDIALISLGVNDLTTGMSKKRFVKTQCEIIDILRSKFGVRQVLLSGFPPVGRFPALPQPSRWYLGQVASCFDQSLQQVAQLKSCDYLKAMDSTDTSLLASDGFHPGPVVYDFWAGKAYEKIRPQLTRF